MATERSLHVSQQEGQDRAEQERSAHRVDPKVMAALVPGPITAAEAND